MVCSLPGDDFFQDLSGQIQLLALIQPCKTDGQDAAKKVVTYRRMGSSFVTDIRNVKNVIGRILTRGDWGVIDRAHCIARTIFDDSDDDA